MPSDMIAQDKRFIDIVTSAKRPYLTAKQAADAIGVPVEKIRAMAQQNNFHGALVSIGDTGRRDVMIQKNVLWRWYFADGIPGVTMPEEF